MKSFKQFNEVAPPGFGHTKSDKEKGVKKGGTAAAFDRARKEGRFKGSKSDMFAIMWSQKKKGAKPHYKPGTDKKYKKYEEDWKPEIEHSKLGDAVKKKREKKRKEAESSLPPHLRLDVMKKAFAHTNESLGFTIDSGEHKKASKKAKLRNLAKGNTNPNEKAAAEKKAGGPKLIGEAKSCPEGQYYCFDMGKCRPIPDGHKVRKDGELVKESLLKKLVDREVRIMGHGGKSEEEVKKIKDKRREKVKKAMDAIPNKSSEVYNKNWQHKTPDNTRESVEIHDANGNLSAEIIDIIKPEPMKVPESPVKWKELTELTKLPNYNKTGNIIDVYLAWRGKNYMIQTFFPQVSKPSRKEVIDQIQKVYPGSRVWNYQISTYNPGEPVLQIN